MIEASPHDTPRGEAVRAYHAEANALLAALARSGLNTPTVAQLPFFHEDYERAIPLLCESLVSTDMLELKQEIATVLAKPWAHAAFATLATELLRENESLWSPWPTKEPSNQLKLSIGTALAAMLTADDYDVVVRLLKNPAAGWGRAPLLEAVVRVSARRKESEGVAISLMNEPSLVVSALIALRKLSAWDRVDLVQPLLDSPVPAVKREAARFLKAAAKAVAGRA